MACGGASHLNPREPVLCFQEKRSLPGDREPAVKRAFKSFVEERDDKFTMELLLLPSALKEELLGLVHSSPSNPVSSAPHPGPPQPFTARMVNLLSCDSPQTDSASRNPGGGAGPLSEQHPGDRAVQPHPGHQL